MSVFKDIEDMKARGFDPSTIEHARRYNACWQAFLDSPIGDYLRNRMPEQDLDSIAKEVESPEDFFFYNGYLPIWNSVGGNQVVYHIETNAFYWADHERLCSNEYVLLPESYEMLPFTLENLHRALIKVHVDDSTKFMDGLMAGEYDLEIE